MTNMDLHIPIKVNSKKFELTQYQRTWIRKPQNSQTELFKKKSTYYWTVNPQNTKEQNNPKTIKSNLPQKNGNEAFLTQEVRRKWSTIFKVLRENNGQRRMYNKQNFLSKMWMKQRNSKIRYL